MLELKNKILESQLHGLINNFAKKYKKLINKTGVESDYASELKVVKNKPKLCGSYLFFLENFGLWFDNPQFYLLNFSLCVVVKK